MEVGLQDYGASHEFISLLGVPFSDRDVEKAKHYSIDDPLDDGRPFEAPVSAGSVFAHRNPFQAADVGLKSPAGFTARLATEGQIETGVNEQVHVHQVEDDKHQCYIGHVDGDLVV